MDRRVVGGVGAVCVAAAVAVGVLAARPGDGGPPGAVGAGTTSTTATTAADLGFPPPGPGVAASVVTYLEGDGAGLLVMHAAATEVAVGGSEADCSDVAARLDTEVPSGTAFDLAGGVVDDVLREALLSERTALGVALTSCIADGDLDDAALAEVVEAVDFRLDQLGVS